MQNLSIPASLNGQSAPSTTLASRQSADAAFLMCNQEFNSVPELARQIRNLATRFPNMEAHANNKMARAADVLVALNRARSVKLGWIESSGSVTIDQAVSAYRDLVTVEKSDPSITDSDLRAVQMAYRVVAAFKDFALEAEATPAPKAPNRPKPR